MCRAIDPDGDADVTVPADRAVDSYLTHVPASARRPPVSAPPPLRDEGLFAYLQRTAGGFDRTRYLQLLGAANPYKEGDDAIGVVAPNEQARTHARTMLAATRLADIDAHPVIDDDLGALLRAHVDAAAQRQSAPWTVGQLRDVLLTQDGTSIAAIARGLSSDVIGCVVKLMSDDELRAVSGRLHVRLPGSQIGAEGFLGARVQPNSPTDHPDDIRWQVFDAWAYGVGDVLLGTNPVSSEPAQVARVEQTLQEVLSVFALTDVLPHCVLAHIDVQAEVEAQYPGRTALWFQSLAGSDAANRTFDVTVAGMLAHADTRTGRFGLYLETGQGADFTNGHGQGADMVLHESRKYGFVRALTARVAAAQARSGSAPAPWVHVNDVAGFIGPEVFRSREQLVRCCLEDLLMGKLHGLTIGLDVCATLHMDIGPADLDWCLEQIMPASPAYLMALPTKVDPMLGYLTTGFQDHVRLRAQFGRRINAPMQAFFESIGVLDALGAPGRHFGDPVHVYLAYCRRGGDTRSDEALRTEGTAAIAAVRARGVFLATGHGAQPHDLEPALADAIHTLCTESRRAFHATLPPAFVATIPHAFPVQTRSADRDSFLRHPTSGEVLSAASIATLQALAAERDGTIDAQIVVSDGLNALAIRQPGHLLPFLGALREALTTHGWCVAPEHVVITSGRVRAGYMAGEQLFAGQHGPRTLLHIVGERPGTGHHTFSVYISKADGTRWSVPGAIDHDLTRVVSGIAHTALAPLDAVHHVCRILGPRD
jgi:ethanolamine ammonia-lyase large subunit